MCAAPFPTQALSPWANRGRPWLAIGLIGLAGLVVRPLALAEGTQSERAARLGFSYDPRVREAATAGRKGDTLELEPPDPGVVRLPKYKVVERAIPLREYEMLTPEGRVELAKKRHLSPIYQKTLGPLAAVAALLHNPLGGWNPNTGEAMAIYEDNENLRRRNEMSDLSGIAEFAEQAKKIRAEGRRQRAEKSKER